MKLNSLTKHSVEKSTPNKTDKCQVHQNLAPEPYKIGQKLKTTKTKCVSSRNMSNYVTAAKQNH